ncbi:hypothetical protein [Xanthomonas phage XPP9]|nr:hypothetical protein [Xanthomonas phage XPP9]AVO24161.1 hypothetical protein [Xanthomonas phage XPP9]
MTDNTRHARTLIDFLRAIDAHKPAFVAALRDAGYAVAPGAPVRTLVRLARTSSDRPGLDKFEQDIRDALAAYHKAAGALVLPEAQFLLAHFEQSAKVPLHTNPVKRVVSWLRRNVRSAFGLAGDVN